MSWGTSYTYEGYLSRVGKNELERKKEECQRINDMLWREILAYMASTPWLGSINDRIADISMMTIAQGHELHSELNTPPQYVDIEINGEQLNFFKKQIEHFLDTKEIEWLIERFKKMSQSAKNEFIKILKEEL